jgi:hypothetical protein
MRYRNKVTGAIIDVASELNGKNWEKIGGKAEKPAAIPTVPTEEVIETPKKRRRTTKK